MGMKQEDFRVPENWEFCHRIDKKYGDEEDILTRGAIGSVMVGGLYPELDTAEKVFNALREGRKLESPRSIYELREETYWE